MDPHPTHPVERALQRTPAGTLLVVRYSRPSGEAQAFYTVEHTGTGFDVKRLGGRESRRFVGAQAARRAMAYMSQYGRLVADLVDEVYGDSALGSRYDAHDRRANRLQRQHDGLQAQATTIQAAARGLAARRARNARRRYVAAVRLGTEGLGGGRGR